MAAVKEDHSGAGTPEKIEAEQIEKVTTGNESSQGKMTSDGGEYLCLICLCRRNADFFMASV